MLRCGQYFLLIPLRTPLLQKHLLRAFNVIRTVIYKLNFKYVASPISMHAILQKS